MHESSSLYRARARRRGARLIYATGAVAAVLSAAMLTGCSFGTSLDDTDLSTFGAADEVPQLPDESGLPALPGAPPAAPGADTAAAAPTAPPAAPQAPAAAGAPAAPVAAATLPPAAAPPPGAAPQAAAPVPAAAAPPAAAPPAAAPPPGPPGSTQTAAVTSSPLLAVFAPTAAGRALTAADAVYAERAAQQTLEYNLSGSQVRWENPVSQNFGTITLTRTYQRKDGTYCREFVQTVEVQGSQETAYGTACREVDGTWTILQ